MFTQGTSLPGVLLHQVEFWIMHQVKDKAVSNLGFLKRVPVNHKEKVNGERNKDLKNYQNVIYSLPTARTSFVAARYCRWRRLCLFLNKSREEVLGIGIHDYVLRIDPIPSSRTLSQWILRILLLSSHTCYVRMLQPPFFSFLVEILIHPYFCCSSFSVKNI